MHKQKVFKMSHGDFLDQEHKRNLFLGFFLGCYFSRILQMSNYLMSFIDK